MIKAVRFIVMATITIAYPMMGVAEPVVIDSQTAIVRTAGALHGVEPPSGQAKAQVQQHIEANQSQRQTTISHIEQHESTSAQVPLTVGGTYAHPLPNGNAAVINASGKEPALKTGSVEEQTRVPEAVRDASQAANPTLLPIALKKSESAGSGNDDKPREQTSYVTQAAKEIEAESKANELNIDHRKKALQEEQHQ